MSYNTIHIILNLKSFLIKYIKNDANHKAISKGTMQIKLKNGKIIDIQEVFYVST